MFGEDLYSKVKRRRDGCADEVATLPASKLNFSTTLCLIWCLVFSLRHIKNYQANQELGKFHRRLGLVKV